MSTETKTIGNVSYVRSGAGAPVLFIQGVGLASRAWQPQVAALSKEFDCIALDNRGVGANDADTQALTIDVMVADTIALLDGLNIQRVHVIGHSMGGVIAQQLALDNPNRVKSLSLLCTFSRGKDALTLSWNMLVHGIATSIGTAKMRREAFARMVMPALYLEEVGINYAVQQLETTFGRALEQPPKVVSRQLRAMGRHDATSRLVQLQSIPSFVMSATHDPIARPIYGKRLATAIGAKRLVEVPTASHALPIQLPELVNRQLREHLLSVT